MRISDWSSDVCSSDLRLRQTRCRNILAKCSRSIKQLMAARDFPPKRIMILHIQVHGFVRSAMVNQIRSEEHTSELQSLMRISYAVFCLKKKNKTNTSIST